MNIKVDHIEYFLNKISIEMKVLQTSRQRYANQLAPDFSVFNYIHTDEIMLSRIIADLLNPDGQHAQGTHFLKLFLKMLSCEKIIDQFDLNTAKVQTEVSTYKIKLQRRMDIYIQAKNFDQHSVGICIENKPFAVDQPNQLHDYADEMEQRHPDHWHIIYLCDKSLEPSNISVSTNTLQDWKNKKKFTTIEYPQLIEWLSDCKSICQNERVTTFITAFIHYISQTFLGIQDMSESKYIVDLILKDEKSLEAALCVEHQLHIAKSNLMQTLNQQMIHLCSTRGWIFKDSNLTEKQVYNGFEIEFPFNIENISFGLEFQKSGYRMPFLGVWMNEIQVANLRLNEKIRLTLIDLFTEKTNSSKNWPFYINLQISETEMWLHIQNGQFATTLINHFLKIETALKNIHSN